MISNYTRLSSENWSKFSKTNYDLQEVILKQAIKNKNQRNHKKEYFWFMYIDFLDAEGGNRTLTPEGTRF